MPDETYTMIWRGLGVAMLSLGAMASLSGAAELTGNGQVTFTKDISPIFQEKCEECHRKGTNAPMALGTYEEVRPWAKAIKQRVVTRNMPPGIWIRRLAFRNFRMTAR